MVTRVAFSSLEILSIPPVEWRAMEVGRKKAMNMMLHLELRKSSHISGVFDCWYSEGTNPRVRGHSQAPAGKMADDA